MYVLEFEYNPKCTQDLQTEANVENQLQLTGCAFSKACRRASTRRCKSRTSRNGPHRLGVKMDDT